ncbi:MAG TPA: HD domain-containing phosphohydrolase [Candidatus Dormibacteraeota bacterium]|jgi:putative two-component system response regulator|nr:HD domain-containing phosphohydrolase [Candidatus Dormibacteraeota bacterium]
MPRVLIADDDRLIRAYLQKALTLAGYDVVAAADGTEAIRTITSAGAFDLVITDYSMPGASGIEVINHVQRIDPALPCIIVTAFHDLDLAMRGMQAGAVGFIPKPFKPEHLLTVAGRALERRQLAADSTRLSLLVPMLERFTMLLANTLESKDCATSRHAERLVEHGEAVARELGLDDDARFSVRVGACLHDIGKVGIPETLLRKAGPLTPAERQVMQLHPEIGAAILEDIDTWQDVRMIVRHHHEHWNGAGYPLGLQGAGIPLGARIVSVVDAFDVMVEGRPYQAARPLDVVAGELLRQRGVQFDGDVVDAFLRTISGSGHYHDVVDTVAELGLIARRAETVGHSRHTVVGAAP